MRTSSPRFPVAAVDREAGFDAWERRESRLFAALPYVMLAASVTISLIQSGYPQRLWLVLSVSAVAAGWTWWFLTAHPRWRDERPGLMAVYFVGFLAMTATLVLEAPWFGIYAWVGFVHSFECLRGPWRFAGQIATAVLMAITQSGGQLPTTPRAAATWLMLVAVNATVAGAFTYIAYITQVHNRKRKEALVELEEANAKLERALEENAGLHAQLLVQAREAGMLDERQRLASEIHDTLAQGFTGIITQLQAAEQAADDPVRWRRHLDTAAALARENLAEARRSVQALTPQALDKAPLPEALQDLTERWSSIRDTQVAFTTTGTPRPMHPEIEATLLRITQEALSNVDKHAQAGRVGVTLSYMEDQITLDVRDDGIGFSPDAVGNKDSDGGFGLAGMRRRVQRLAGTVSIESEPGAGTAISASLPALELTAPSGELRAPDGVLAVPSETKEKAE
ncbi:sensor histidine kinase [Thermocrispum municipale]|uniref:sensor histidine kinase n=1 Tax=Thermocrispum municipale TaxID=37926 RepID=UPI00040586AD|nr:sensor histidine kinase [Thermocrispum municipale]